MRPRGMVETSLGSQRTGRDRYHVERCVDNRKPSRYEISLVATARSINVHLRLKPREAKMWRAAAKRADETVSEWIRKLCNVAAAPPPPPVPPVVSGDQIELPLNGRSKKHAP